jgi:hypothetical protein
VPVVSTVSPRAMIKKSRHRSIMWSALRRRGLCRSIEPVPPEVHGPRRPGPPRTTMNARHRRTTSSWRPGKADTAAVE